MNRLIPVLHLHSGNELNLSVDTASSCPYCGVSLDPTILYAVEVECGWPSEEDYENKVFVFNRCTHCDECFVSRHLYDDDSEVYILDSSSQINFFHIDFSKNISSLSPDFVSIFTESAHAESLGLTSICGVGYRKSLEFLVKDYAASFFPNDISNIASLPLSKCIDQYIMDPRLKALAKASAWLGNDATHYVKKHANYGLPELKSFIYAFVTYIDSELAFRDAEALVSP